MTWFGLGSQVDERLARYIDNAVRGSSGVGSHAGTHIDGGGDALDGDKLEVSWSPSNYTRDSSISEADSTDDLSAHLKGVDTALAARPLLTALSGTSFPGSPSNGDMFFHKTHREYFSYHSGNSVWVGPENVVYFGKGGTGFNTTYLRLADAISSGTKGWLVPNDIMITKVSAVWTTTTTSGNIQIRRDGTNVVDLNIATITTSNTTAQSLAVDTNFDKHNGSSLTGVMGVYLSALGTGGTPHSGVNHPVVAVYWRRRET